MGGGPPLPSTGDLNVDLNRVAAENAPSTLEQLMKVKAQFNQLVALRGGAQQELLLSQQAFGGSEGAPQAGEEPYEDAERAPADVAGANEPPIVKNGPASHRGANDGLAG